MTRQICDYVRDDGSKPRWDNGMYMTEQEVAGLRALQFPIKIARFQTYPVVEGFGYHKVIVQRH